MTDLQVVCAAQSHALTEVRPLTEPVPGEDRMRHRWRCPRCGDDVLLLAGTLADVERLLRTNNVPRVTLHGLRVVVQQMRRTS